MLYPPAQMPCPRAKPLTSNSDLAPSTVLEIVLGRAVRLRGSRRVGPRALVVVLMAAALLAAPRAQAEDAVASVLRIYQTVVQTGNAPDRLARRLGPSIDLKTLAARVLGKAYQEAPARDRADFEAVLLDVIALELSKRLGPDQEFVVLRSRDMRDREVVVFTRLTRADGSERLIDWKMRPCGTAYCIFDLRRDNASFTAARRDDYAARLQAAGGSLAGLTADLRAEVAARQ